MSTLAEIVSGVEQLPEASRKKILVLVKEELKEVKSNPFAPLTRERVLSDINISEQQLAEGKGMDAQEALIKIGQKHGFI